MTKQELKQAIRDANREIVVRVSGDMFDSANDICMQVGHMIEAYRVGNHTRAEMYMNNIKAVSSKQ